MDEYQEWYASLDKNDRDKADSLQNKLQALGEDDPELTVYSEMTEDIPQLARMRFLYGLKMDIQEYDKNPEQVVESTLKHGFEETKAIVSKMLDSGFTHEEIAALMKFSVYDGMYNVIMRLEDPTIDGLEEGYPYWTLLETDDNFEPTGREVNGLHESLLWVINK